MASDASANLVIDGYYTDGRDLYYVYDLDLEHELALIENCLTNESVWMKLSFIDSISSGFNKIDRTLLPWGCDR